ncbi:MAG: hypothetical protein JSR44_01150 [Spirochaetes bacterium]|nr:hypothetical protein [Spirochaetota bacterium]
MTESPITPHKEWEVIFNEGTHWRVGIYRPPLRSAAAIRELEQHSCPEAFLLLSGTLVMVYRNADGALVEKKLQLMELTTFTEPHAGYSPDGSGVAYVVENAQFETVYTDKLSGAETRRVRV